MKSQDKEWVIGEPSEDKWKAFASAQNLSPLTSKILLQRGIEPENVQRFLNPSLEDLHDPFLMKDMRLAVAEVLKAILRGQKITIHGDYDVDGVSSVSVLLGFLTDIGANVAFYIPLRNQDGYGLNKDSVKRFSEDGTGLIITVDCGVSNYDEVEYANSLGMRVVIVDHHTIPEQLPPAKAVLNPLREDCDYPYTHLAAVGVTFKLVCGIISELRKRNIFDVVPEPNILSYLDLVSMGTIADVMPLTGENRTLVRLGLEVLSKRRRAGVAALMERASVDPGPVPASIISYRLAPRINAAGRMSDAAICVKLLTTQKYATASKLAAQLDELNASRQEEERAILANAIEQAELRIKNNQQVLVVYGKGWHRGVLGIVASRLAEKFHLPSVVVGVDDAGLAKGSARSVEGINLVAAFTCVNNRLETFGGHAFAAGLSLKEENLENFATELNAAIEEGLENDEVPKAKLRIDAEVELGELNPSLLKDLRLLSPFGNGNPEPVLYSKDIQASNVRIVSKLHLRASFRDQTGRAEGFGFMLSHDAQKLRHPVAIAFVPKNYLQESEKEIELQLKGVSAKSNISAAL